MHFGQRVGVDRLAHIADMGCAVVGEVRSRALAPTNEKKKPNFATAELLELLGKDDNWLEYRLKREEPPMPERIGARNYYSLESVQEWCRKERSQYLRPQGVEGLVICIGNYKGGSGKTTTAATLAQGLSIRGHRVLVIDTDGQASLSNLYGVLPDIDEVQTILPVCTGELGDVMPLVMHTYWTGVDLIAANKTLSLANAVLPTQESYWWLLRNALQEAKKHYDVILLDTSPSLDPLPVTCLMASDGLVMPVTPNGLDFASSTQYWSLFSDMLGDFTQGAQALEYDFVRILLTRVDSQDRNNVAAVRGLMKATYGEYLMETEIPKTSYASGATTSFGTVYDPPPYKIPRRAIMQFKRPFELFVNSIEHDLCNAWARRAAALNQ